MPSSSARCSQLPRAIDKLPFYVALHKLRDHLRGDVPNLDDSEVIFPDLELKVEPKKERLDTQVKQELEDPETKADLIPNRQTLSGTFQLTVQMKTEDEPVSGKRKKGRRKRSSTAGSDGKQISAPDTVGSSSGTVCSPYFLPWQQPYPYPSDSVRTGSCTNAETVDVTVTGQVKQETLVNSAQYGHMPVNLSTVRTYGSMPPLPDVKPAFCWRPTDL